MPDEKSPFLRKLLNEKSDLPEENAPFTSERQLTAQALNLHVDFRGGRHAEGVGWAHYFTYRWLDKGEQESLDVIFSGRLIEIEGHNLRPLMDQLREGKLNGVLEMVTAQAELKRVEADEGPIISAVKIYPDFEELKKEIKGDGKDAGETGFTQRIRR